VRAAQRELEVLRGHEVTVEWVVPVESHAAVHVLGGGDDTSASLRREELRDGKLLVGIEPLIEAPARLPH
jgi:hypothetical protein